jgi:crossover junction endodeoxyribonuclease RuvC
VRIFGIDPGSARTGYGCVETDGRVARLVTCGAITAPGRDPFPQRLARIHRELSALIASNAPDCVAIESLFSAVNARTALKLGHARGVAMLAAVQCGCPVVEYTPAAVKRAVVGYGRAEKHQVQQMIKLLLGLTKPPSPHDAADALAVAICHLHSVPPADLAPHRAGVRGGGPAKARLYDGGSRKAAGADLPVRLPKTWRDYRPPANG